MPEEGNPPEENPPHRVPVEDSIDLHAFSPRDVTAVVEEYLEAAASEGYREVRIIHGKGTGVQRAAVRGVLSRHPLVESFTNAPGEAGGWGATLVTLRTPG